MLCIIKRVIKEKRGGGSMAGSHVRISGKKGAFGIITIGQQATRFVA